MKAETVIPVSVLWNLLKLSKIHRSKDLKEILSPDQQLQSPALLVNYNT